MNNYNKKDKIPFNGFAGGNTVYRYGTFRVSYQPRGGGFLMTGTQEETALINNRGRTIYRILDGDFRKEYDKLAPRGFKACKEFYESKKDKYDSPWSSL